MTLLGRISNLLNKSWGVKTEAVRACTANQTKKGGSKQKSKSENPRRAQSFNEPFYFARTHSHDVGTRTKKPVRKPQLCGAEQTRPKKSGSKKKAQKWKSKKSAKLQRTFLLCKNKFPRRGNTDQKIGPKTAALWCWGNQTERKQQLAKEASKEAERTHLRGDGSREKKSKQTLKKYFVIIHKRTSQTTHKTHGHPHPATPPTPSPPPPPPPPNRPPPPPQNDPPKTPTDQRQILAWVLDQCHWTQRAWKCILQWIRE